MYFQHCKPIHLFSSTYPKQRRCGHNPIPAVKGDMHLDRCSTMRQPGILNIHVFGLSKEGGRRKARAALPSSFDDTAVN